MWVRQPGSRAWRGAAVRGILVRSNGTDAMPIKMKCECGQAYQFRDQHAGGTFDCVSCGKRRTVPGRPPAPLMVPKSAPKIKTKPRSP